MSDDLRTRIAAALKTANDRVAGFIGYDEMADAVIAVVQPLLEAEYNRGYDEGVDWLHDESRWIKGEDTDDA